MTIYTDIREGITTCDGIKYPLKLNGKKFSYYDGCPKWIMETALDFREHFHEFPSNSRSKWKFEMDKYVFYRMGFEKFGQIEDCIQDFVDREIDDIGIVYKDLNCLLYVPPGLIYEESNIFSKIIYKILKMTRYNFHNICPMTFLLKKSKWFNWMLEVCDLGIDFKGEYRGITYHLTDDIIIVNLIPKDTQIMVDDFFDKFLNDEY